MSERGDPLVGTVIADRFRILERIAAGGMGVVYKAEQQPLGRKVAVKILRNPQNPTIDLQFGKRFLLEAAAVANLSHPNTIVVHDYGQVDDETLYLAMEYLDGMTVADRTVQQGPMEPLHAIHVALQIAGSLGEAHGQGLVHRDLKPGNVMIQKRGANPLFVKVLDFGLVKMVGQDQSLELTQSGVMMGSPAYMAPEQVQARDVDHRCDIYSFGVILYFMLTGHPPFNGESQFEVMRAHVCSEPPPFRHVFPGCRAPASLEHLTMHCLRKHPNERPQSMDDVAQLLMACEAELGYSRPMSSAGFPLPNPSGVHPGVQPPVVGHSSVAHQVTPFEGHAHGYTPSGVQGNVVTGGGYANQNLADSQPNPAYASGGNHAFPHHQPGFTPSGNVPIHVSPSGGTPMGGVHGYSHATGGYPTSGNRWVWQALVVLVVAGIAAGIALAYPLFQPVEIVRPNGHETAHPPRDDESQRSTQTNQTNEESNQNTTEQNTTETNSGETGHVETAVTRLPVRIVSRPSGALLVHDQTQLGQTPLTLEIPEGERWEVTVLSPGYETRTVVIDGSEPNMTVRLDRQVIAGNDFTGTSTMNTEMVVEATVTEMVEVDPVMTEMMNSGPTKVDDGLRNPWGNRQ